MFFSFLVLHEMKLVHTDLKPENILLLSDETYPSVFSFPFIYFFFEQFLCFFVSTPFILLINHPDFVVKVLSNSSN